jgi:hypothetical protein
MRLRKSQELSNRGWSVLFPVVFRVPETATVLMSGGISFGELNQEQVMSSAKSR